MDSSENAIINNSATEFIVDKTGFAELAHQGFTITFYFKEGRSGLEAKFNETKFQV